MKQIRRILQTVFFSISFLWLIACNNAAEKDKTTSPTNGDANTTTTVAKPTKKTDNAIVRFKINGVDANTKIGVGNDNAEQLGIVNGTNNHLSFVLNGDDAKFPFRGSLSMGLDNFSFKSGEYKCNTSFSRYQRPNAAGEIQYDSQRGGSFTINFSSITKSTDSNMVGEAYEATGTFSGKLGLKMGFEKDSEVKTIDITEGYFEKVPIQVYGKN
jgi:hypothetical protein